MCLPVRETYHFLLNSGTVTRALAFAPVALEGGQLVPVLVDYFMGFLVGLGYEALDGRMLGLELVPLVHEAERPHWIV